MRFGFRRPTSRSGGPAAAALAILIGASIPTPTIALAGASHDRHGGPPTPSHVTAAWHGPAADHATTAAPVDDPTAGLQPSVQYEEAVAHEHDRIAFAPGGRVTVGFSPRPGDPWTVGGGAPKSLPAGRLDGKAIRAQGPRSTVTISATIDAPIETGPALAATPASFSPSADAQATPSVTPQAAVSLSGLRREIFGFLPYWEVNSTSLRLDYAKISTIAYFGLGADAAGNLQKRNSDGTATVGWSGWTSSRLTSIISAAHTNHTRVVLTVQSFAWNTSGQTRQQSLLGSSPARLNLARQIAAAARDRGVDGVNLDFEPLATGYEAQFTALVRTIRAELNRIHSGYQITFDTTGSIGNYQIEDATASGGADAIFIMGYDYRVASSSPVGSVAPYEKSGYDIVDTVGAYTARVAPSKLILGVPYYGRAWSTSGNGLNAPNISGTQYGASTTVVYDTAADYLAQYGRRYDPLEEVAWTTYQRQNCTATYGCVSAWRELYVDDATAIGRKYDLVNAYGLRGAGIWALGYDGTRPDLYAAIQLKFITDTTPPTVGIQTLPGRQLNPDFAVSWTGVDDVAVVSYDGQVSIDGGPWTPWFLGSKLGSATWHGLDNHTYAFRVRARDPKGNVSAWNVASTSVAAPALAPGGFGVSRVDGLSVRTGGDTSGTKVGTLANGDLVAIVGGPRSADGYTWFQVIGPLTTWGAVRPAFSGRWVAASSATSTMLVPTKAPNATQVAAMIGDLGFSGGGAASIGPGAGAVGSRSFSPNGDGSKDTLVIAWTNGVALDALVMKVFRADGTPVGSVPLASQVGAGDRHVAWDGRVAGSLLPNGRYLVTLVGSAGGTTYDNPSTGFLAVSLAWFGVTIDTVAPAISSAAISGSLISPNGDGILDTVRASIAGSGATSWAFGVAPVTGVTVGPPVLVRSGGGASAAVTWDGKNAAGAIVPDGTYRLQLLLSDAAGNRAGRTWTVRADRTRPTLTTTPPATFSPNGDGAFDTARLAWSSTEPITGTLRVYRGTTLVRSWSIRELASGAATWTGTNAAGAAVADGTYTVRVSGRDAAGNPASAVAAIVVDRTLSTLRWGTSPFFPQDGDSLAARSVMSVRLSRAAVVSAAVYSGTTLIRSIWTNTSLAAGAHAWTWNGKNTSGAFVPRGVYVVRVTARTSLGTTVLTRSILADAFNVSLSSTSLRAGQPLTVTFTTVEPMRSSPYVTFTQPGRAAIRTVAASLGSGRYRVTFVVGSGPAGSATIAIAGRDTSGGVNTTTRTVTIR